MSYQQQLRALQGELEPPFSQSDAIIIHQSEADAPGVYISSEQNQVDAYGQMIQNQNLYQHNSPLDMNVAPTPLHNPNAKVVEGYTKTLVNPQGNYIVNF